MFQIVICTWIVLPVHNIYGKIKLLDKRYTRRHSTLLSSNKTTQICNSFSGIRNFTATKFNFITFFCTARKLKMSSLRRSWSHIGRIHWWQPDINLTRHECFVYFHYFQQIMSEICIELCKLWLDTVRS